METIKVVFDVLEDPDRDDLESMNLQDLKFLLDISADPLGNTVKDMSPSEKKHFLAWTATELEVAQIIADAEDEFEVLKEIFGKTTPTTIVAEVNKSVESGKSFVEVALAKGNDVALQLAS